MDFLLEIIRLQNFSASSAHRLKQSNSGRKAAAFVAVCSTMAAILSFLNAAVGCKSVLSYLADYSV